MKKQTLLIIVLILLLTMILVGATYAFFSSSTNTNELKTESSTFEVIYTGQTEFDGIPNLITGQNDTEKMSAKVNIRVAEGSAKPKSTIYINIEKITETLAKKGFVWEVYGYKNGTLVYSNEGTFEGKNDTTNNIINIVEDYQLAEENTEFTIYLWLDGNQLGNEIFGAEFAAYVGAKTENFQGLVQ